MEELRKALFETLPKFMRGKLNDVQLSLQDVPPGLQEVVLNHAEQNGQRDWRRPGFCEELVSQVIDTVWRQRFQSLALKPGGVKKTGRQLLSLLYVRTLYLATLVDERPVQTSGDVLDCLDRADYLKGLWPPGVSPELVAEVDSRIKQLRMARGKKPSGTVRRHQDEGLEMLAQAIWQAYRAIAQTCLPGSELPAAAPELPWLETLKAQFRQRVYDDAEVEGTVADGLASTGRSETPALRDERVAASPEPVPPCGETELADQESIHRPGEVELAERKTAFRARSWLPYRQSSPLIPRHELIEQLKARLLAGDGPTVLGVWGPAGAGKTALMQLLCEDPDIEEHFDLALWADLGPAAGEPPGTLGATTVEYRQLAAWAEALSLPATSALTADALSLALRERLRDTPALLVLDDAWSLDAVRPFLIGSAQGRVVVTTRNRTLFETLAHSWELLAVPGMTLPEAQVLVGQVTGQGVEVRDARLRLLHDRLEGSPLALGIAASHLRSLGWDQVAAYVQSDESIIPLLELGEGHSRDSSVWASLALQYERLKPAQQLLFRSLGALAPAPVSAEMAHAACRQGTVPVVEQELSRLADLSLLREQQEDQAVRLFRLPALGYLYAQHLLRQAGELEASREQCADEQVRWVEALHTRFYTAGEEPGRVLGEFRLTLPHVDYAFRQACDRRDAVRVGRLLDSCPPLLVHSGHDERRQAWLALTAQWLGRESATNADDCQLIVEWHLQRAEGFLERGESHTARETLEELRRMRMQNAEHRARYRLSMASAALQLGRMARARRTLRQAIRSHPIQYNPGLRFRALSLQARLFRAAHLPFTILRAHAQAILAARVAGSVADELAERLSMAESLCRFGWTQKALTELEYVAATAGQNGLLMLHRAGLEELAALYLDVGRLRLAVDAVDRLRPLGDPEVIARLEARLAGAMPAARPSNAWFRPETARRIVIVGEPGIDPVPFGHQVAGRLAGSVVDLDTVCRQFRSPSASAAELRERVVRALSGESWIAAGDCEEVRDIAWGRAELIVWLCYSPAQVLRESVSRLWGNLGGRRAAHEAINRAYTTWQSLLRQAMSTYLPRSTRPSLRFCLDGIEQVSPPVVALQSLEAALRWLKEMDAARSDPLGV